MKLISTNPSQNYTVLGEIEMTSKDGVLAAVQQSRDAFPIWSSLSLQKRCAYLSAFIRVAEARKEEIALLIAQETGRTIASARANVQGGITYFTAYIEMAEEHLRPKTTYETPTELHRVYREPRGVIACICPWNYPFMNVVWQCGQALIAGNTIVYKNSEENPLFAKLLDELFAQADLPKGVFSIIYGDGEVGEWLVDSPIDMISFTGSSKTGRFLTMKAAEKFIPIVTELGGSSPLILFEDIEITDEVIAYIYGRRFKNSGQACDSVKRLIVHESKYDAIVERLTAYMNKQKIGDASKEDTEIGPLVAKRQVDFLQSQVDDAVSKGAKIMTNQNLPDDLKGAYFAPTILTNVTYDMRVWHEETFGPVLPIVSFSTEEEAIALANDTEYGLSAHIMTNDKNRFSRVARELKAGSIGQNQVMFWHPSNPFGGYKNSGMGRTHGEYGFYEVTQTKIVSEEK